MRYPGGKSKAITFSYDDGVAEDRRLVEIFNKNGLKGTFNLISSRLDSGTAIRPEELAPLYLDAGHEVAVHAVNHPFFDQLSPDEALYEIVQCRRRLEQLTGTVVRGMAYSEGPFNDMAVAQVQAAGMLYSRTTISTENFRLPEDFLRLPATCHHKNPRLFELAEQFVSSSPDKQYNQKAWLFYIWGHSYEFARDNNWDRIEQFAETVGGHDDVWYATNIDIFDYITAYRRLLCSADGKTVKNPSSREVWLQIDTTLFRIPAGETVKLS